MDTQNQYFLPSRIACIVPRYAKSIGGGAETLVRELAHALVGFGEIQLEVWSTCALDHRTWANEAPQGVEWDGPIKVTRFPVDERDLEIFITSEHKIQGGEPFSPQEQLAWLGASVNSQSLYRHIQQHGRDFDVLLFAPYLFATSFWGSLIYPERSVVIPCLHDEAYAYLEVFQSQFSKVAGLMCNAEPERELLRAICGDAVSQERTSVVGMGFEPATRYAKKETITCNGIEISEPYILYSGRKEVGKNVDFLIECFEAVPHGTCSLVLIGAGSIDFRDSLPAGVLDLGFVSEEDKLQLMAGSLALCQPSCNESFSIVMMEAWQQGVPCLVHGASAVTSHHVRVSAGGLYFENPIEFRGVVEFLLKNPVLAKEMGENGRRYVATEYAWENVVRRFAYSMKRFGLLGDSPQPLPNVA